MRFLSAIFGCLLFASSAHAQAFARCADYQIADIQSILPGAQELAVQSAARVDDSAEYATWFGSYSDSNAEIVRTNLKRIHRALIDERLRFYCGHPNEPICRQGSYAYVYRTEPFAMTLCPAFFSLPTMPGGSANDGAYEFGTMEGTIIHEMSHFEVIAGTDDVCYGRTTCEQMARTDPQSAIRNADTYQYFAEDVGFSIIAASERK